MRKKGGVLSGAYYTFETTSMDSDVWKEILTFRHDDQVGIPTAKVHFVNDKVGFVFMGWMCAVTKDGGFSWSVWDAVKDLPDRQCCNYGLIQNVSIEANGSGVMSLKPIRERRGEVVTLLTKDYGQNWTVEAKDA